MSNYKAAASAAQIAQDIAQRLSPTLVAVVDLSGTDPVVNFGTQAAGARCFAVKVLDQRAATDGGWQALPGFGSVAQTVYTGTVFQIAYEKAAAGTWPIVTSVTTDDLLKIVGDLTRRGARVDLYSTTANGAAPAWNTLQGSFDPNIYWPLQGRV